MKKILLAAIIIVLALIVILGITSALYLKEYNSVLLIVSGLVVFFLGRSLSKDHKAARNKRK